MPAVETRILRASFANMLGAMRDWLDNNATGPVKFETASEGGGTILIRVEFTRDEQAQDFAARFPTDPAALRLQAEPEPAAAIVRP